MSILLILHSIIRWIILLVALIAILKFALGWLRSDAFKGMDRGLAAGYSGLMDLQAILGIIYFLWNGFTMAGFPLFRFEHAFVMLLAIIAAHLPRRWKNADDRTHFRNNLFAIVASVILILIGISILPGGLTR